MKEAKNEFKKQFGKSPDELMGLNTDYKSWNKALLKRREELENSDGIMLNVIEQEWVSINRDDEFNKRDNLENISDNPLGILDYFMEMCTYPPPELLIVICDMYKKYIHSHGSISLDEVFFGPPKKGIGNYAAQKAKCNNQIFRTFHGLKNKKEFSFLNDFQIYRKVK